MIKEEKIHYVKHDNISKARWDACIDASPNGLVYAYSWYLDSISIHWDALILNDYEAVMPLTWNKKWGIRYLYQPTITPQLGIFSDLTITPALVTSFLTEACRHFRFAEIFLNYQCESPGLRKHTNYILSLNDSYENIYAGYKKSLIKNLNRSAKFNFKYVKDFDLQTSLNLYTQLYAGKTPHVKPSDWKRFETLCLLAQSKGLVVTRAAYTQEDELLAVSMLFKKRGRIYLLESTTLPKGRQLEANHFLIDSIIREFSDTETVFDFEGSDIPGIAYYYSTFGSTDQPYFFFHNNKLPWWIRWLKK